ncbi:alpha-hydroxy acid oxidase [Nocardia sp. NPDC055029]
MSKVTARIQSFDDALYFAKKRVPKGIMQQFVGGSGANHTVRRNRDAFDAIEFLPRSAIVHPTRDLSTTVLGHKISTPIYLSAVGALRAGHVEGELAVTRAAGAAGTIQFVSGVSSTSIEEITAQATGPIFQQLYFFDGPSDMTASVIERAKAAGVTALVLIGDSATHSPGAHFPVGERAYAPLGLNLMDAIKFLPQVLAKPAWAWDFLRNGMKEPKPVMARRADGSAMSMKEGAAASFIRTPSWEDLPWIRQYWDGPLVMKGIISVESAKRAVDEGIDAIVVSNHGGNMLDGTIASIEALPAISDAVGGDLDILLDSGVTKGTDVVKALSLGAKAVGLGRGYLYPLLAAGEEGVGHMLGLLNGQVDQALAWLGVSSVRELDRTFLRMPGQAIC